MSEQSCPGCGTVPSPDGSLCVLCLTEPATLPESKPKERTKKSKPVPIAPVVVEQRLALTKNGQSARFARFSLQTDETIIKVYLPKGATSAWVVWK